MWDQLRKVIFLLLEKCLSVAYSDETSWEHMSLGRPARLAICSCWWELFAYPAIPGSPHWLGTSSQCLPFPDPLMHVDPSSSSPSLAHHLLVLLLAWFLTCFIVYLGSIAQLLASLSIQLPIESPTPLLHLLGIARNGAMMPASNLLQWISKHIHF